MVREKSTSHPCLRIHPLLQLPSFTCEPTNSPKLRFKMFFNVERGPNTRSRIRQDNSRFSNQEFLQKKDSC